MSNRQKETEVSLLFQKRTSVIQKLKKDPNNPEALKEKEMVEEKLATIVGKENREKFCAVAEYVFGRKFDKYLKSSLLLAHHTRAERKEQQATPQR